MRLSYVALIAFISSFPLSAKADENAQISACGRVVIPAPLADFESAGEFEFQSHYMHHWSALGYRNGNTRPSACACFHNGYPRTIVASWHDGKPDSMDRWFSGLPIIGRERGLRRCDDFVDQSHYYGIGDGEIRLGFSREPTQTETVRNLKRAAIEVSGQLHIIPAQDQRLLGFDPDANAFIDANGDVILKEDFDAALEDPSRFTALVTPDDESPFAVGNDAFVELFVLSDAAQLQDWVNGDLEIDFNTDTPPPLLALSFFADSRLVFGNPIRIENRVSVSVASENRDGFDINGASDVLGILSVTGFNGEPVSLSDLAGDEFQLLQDQDGFGLFVSSTVSQDINLSGGFPIRIEALPLSISVAETGTEIANINLGVWRQ